MRFVFGRNFCDLVFYGLDAEKSGCISHNFRLTAQTADGKKYRCQFEFDNCDSIARGDDPLVIAALLKIYLERGGLEDEFDFGLAEIADQLGWHLTDENEARIVATLIKHARARGIVFVVKESCRKADAPFEDDIFRGLLFGTFSFGMQDVSEQYPQLSRYTYEIKFDRAFIEGLRAGKVVIGKISLGDLNLKIKNGRKN